MQKPKFENRLAFAAEKGKMVWFFKNLGAEKKYD
jgi:hypothetical protein